MPLYDVEIEYIHHCTYVVEADSASEAEKIGRKRLHDDLTDEIEERDPIPEDFDVIEVAEQV